MCLLDYLYTPVWRPLCKPPIISIFHHYFKRYMYTYWYLNKISSKFSIIHSLWFFVIFRDFRNTVYKGLELSWRPPTTISLLKKFDSKDPKMAEFYTGFFIFRNNALTIKFIMYLCLPTIKNAYILKLIK